MDFYDLIVEDDFTESSSMTTNNRINKRNADTSVKLTELKVFIEKNYLDPHFDKKNVEDHLIQITKGTSTNPDLVKRHFFETYGMQAKTYLEELRNNIPLKRVNNFLDEFLRKKSVAVHDVQFMKATVASTIINGIKEMESDGIPFDKICKYLSITEKEYYDLKRIMQ